MFVTNAEKRAPYIRSKIDYYTNRFSNMEMTSSKVSWNWCAFLFTSYWLIYRKMYKLFAVVAVIELILIPAAASFVESLQLLNLVVCVLLGLFGNYLYMKNIDNLIENEPADTTALIGYHEKNGGTTYFVWIYLGVAAVFNTISPFAS